jgi:hypothetical protein
MDVSIKRKTVPLAALAEVMGEAEVEKLLTVMYGRRLLGRAAARQRPLTRAQLERAREVVESGVVGTGQSSKYVPVMRRYFATDEKSRIAFLNWCAGEIEKLEPGARLPRRRSSPRPRPEPDVAEAI